MSGLASFSVEGKRLASDTILAVVDPAAYKKARLGKLRYAHHTTIDSDHREFLKKQGINVGPTTRGIAYINPDVINTEKSGSIISAVGPIVHEIGHGASKQSGIYGTTFRRSKEFYNRTLDDLEDRFATADDFSILASDYIDVMKQHAFEEGRAQSFSIESIQKGMLDIGYDAERVSTSLSRETSGYIKPIGFTNYSSRYEPKLRSILKQIGQDVKIVQGPLSGKVNLTSNELMDEITLLARTRAAATFSGVLKNISGPAGEAISKTVDYNTEYLKAHLDETMDPIKSERLKAVMDDAMESSKGRQVLVDTAGSTTVKTPSQAPSVQRMVAAAEALTGEIATDTRSEYAESAMRKVPRARVATSGASTRKTIKPSIDASRQVARGKTASKSLKAVGEAGSSLLRVLKARF